MKKRRSIQYLLSADRRLRKLSLRRLSVHAQIPHRSARPAVARRPKKPVAFAGTAGTWLVLTAIGIIAAGVLIGARQPRRDVAGAPLIASAPVETIASAPAEKLPATIAARAEKSPSTPGVITKQMIVPMASETRAIKTGAADAAMTRNPEPRPLAKSRTDAAHAATESVAATPPVEPKSSVKADVEKPVVEKPVVDKSRAEKSPVETAAPVTISGCLEMNDTTFRLKDTAGADVPKSRSWKSAFLMKRASAVRIVDAANTLRLPAHVGHRVSATGTLADGEMHARSLQSVSPSCR